MNPADPLPLLLAQLREHSADRRTAAPALRAAFADLQRQADQPDLFVAVSIETARAALAADEPRFAAERAELAALDRRRFVRSVKQAQRRRTYSATCCIRWYHYDDSAHGHWMNCHGCKKPLVYTADRVRATPAEHQEAA